MTAFRLQEARQDGHNDASIAAYLAQRHGFDLDRARADGVSDTEVAEFLAARPFKAQQSAAQPEAPAEAPPEKSLIRRGLERVSDVGLDLSKGVVGAGEAVVGVGNLLTGNRVGDALASVGYNPKRAKQMIESGYSPQRQTANQAVQDAEGFTGTLEALVDNPSVAVGTMVESAPLMLGSAGAVRALAGQLLARAGIAPGTVAAQQFLSRPDVVAKLALAGSGAEGLTAAGSIQEGARQEGRTYGESAPYAVAGGAGTAAIGRVASRMLPDVDVAAGTIGMGAGRSATVRQGAGMIGKGIVQEGVLEELPQSAQEQVFQNLAQGKPWDENVGEAAAQGLVAGAGMGGGVTSARVAADARTAATTDATTGLEFDPTAIDQAARAQLDPARAQLEQVMRQREAAAVESGDPLNVLVTQAENAAVRTAVTQSEPPDEASPIDQQDLLQRALAHAQRLDAERAGSAAVVPVDSQNQPEPAIALPDASQAMPDSGAALHPTKTHVQAAVSPLGEPPTIEPLPETPVAATITSPPMLMSNGQPFKTARLADFSARQRGLEMQPVEVAGGWGLVPKTAGTGMATQSAGQPIEQTPAAIRNGYSAKTAQWNGPQLLTNSHVSAAVADRVKARERRTAITPNPVPAQGEVEGIAPEQRGELALSAPDQEPVKKETRVVAGVQADTADSAASASRNPATPAASAQMAPPAPLLMASGQPFKSARLAASSAKQRKLDMVPVEVEGGWGLLPASAVPVVSATPEAPASPGTTLAPSPIPAPGQKAKGRDVLLAQIERAKRSTAAPELVARYHDLMDGIKKARHTASLKGTKAAEAARLRMEADAKEVEAQQLRRQIGYRTFKVDGSTFRILNTPPNLSAFALKLKKAPIGRWTVTVRPEDAYESHVETRTGTADAQRTAGRGALRDLLGRIEAHLSRERAGEDGPAIRLLGASIYDGFTAGEANQLVGQRVESPADLATLAQVYRDPRFETFRTFFVKDGEIVGENGYSSRLAASVAVPLNLPELIRSDMASLGADGYYILHNHPSGRAEPSVQDVRLTNNVAAKAPGMLGHVVIDFNEYAVIREAGQVERVSAPELAGIDFKSKPELQHELLGVRIGGPADVVKIAKALQVPGGFSTLILTRSDGEVSMMMDLPQAALADTRSKALGKMKAALRALTRTSGSGGHRFIVLPAGVKADPALGALIAEGLVSDVVTADGESMRGNGAAFWPGDFLADNQKVMQVREQQSPYDPAATSATPPEETGFRAFQRTWQDKFNRFTVIQDWLKRRGVDLTEQADVHKAEERMHGRSATQIEDFRETRVKPIVEKVRKAGFTMGQVADFLHAQHAQERNAQIARINSAMPDGGSGMTDADAQAKLAQYRQTPELEALANELRAITEDTKNLMVSAGILSQDLADTWAGAYQHYVPLKGGPDETAANQGTGRGLTVTQRNKRALGHGAREEWIVENILRDHERAIIQAEKNRVGQHLLEFALQSGHPDLVAIDEPVKRQVLRDRVQYEVRYHGSVVEVFSSLADAQRHVGIESLKGGRDRKDFEITASHDLDVVMMPSPMLEPNETTVYVDGHAIRVQFKDDGLARAWNNLGAESMNVVFRLAREVNNFLSRAYTGYNPEFLGVNVFRDLTTGVLNLSGEEGLIFATKALANYPKAAADLLKYVTTGKASEWVKRYRADGGTTGAAYLSDLERIGKDVQIAFDDYQGVMETWRNGGSYRAARTAARALILPLVRWIEKMNMVGENAMRLAAYRTAVERGESRATAASLAKNSTVNFNRRGEMGQIAGSLYLFFNPAVQGTASVAHALFKGKHKVEAQALTGALVGLGYLLATLNGGGPEDEYDRLPEFQKERFMPIWTGERWVMLPIPYGYGFFSTLGRKMAELEKGEDPAKVSLQLASSFANEFTIWGAAVDAEGDERNVTFLLPTIPQIVMSPIINKTSLGAQVYPESPFDRSKPDNLKLNRSTQGTPYHYIARELNAVTGGSPVQKGWIDVSPETLKYLFTTATGGSGRFVIDSATLVKNLTVEGLPLSDVEAREVPIVRKFVRSPGDVRDARRAFWEAAGKVDEARETFDRAKKLEDHAQRSDMARQIKGEFDELLRLGRLLDVKKKAIRAEREAVDAIQSDDSRTLTERRAMVKEIEIREKKLYDEFLQTFETRTHKPQADKMRNTTP